MKLPRLFKKTSTEALQYWEIESYAIGDSGEIRTEYGQINTESPQITCDTISKGKNIGKKNATTPVEQAKAEAQAKWEKQKKKGYVESPTDALAGELDALIEGGIVPMLAHTVEKQGHKINYPAFVQKKYDGVRIVAILKNGKCTLWSRTRKPVYSLPHIVAEIEKHFKADVILDGEAYNHVFKDNFEHIIHLVRQEDPDQEHTDVEYHIYDIVNDKPFKERFGHLQKCFTIGSPKLQYLKLADTFLVENQEEVTNFYNDFKDQGFEGAMLRNAYGLYVNKRSSDLIKIKEFDDAEFKITGIEEGRGKLAGHVGAFVCITKEGKEFLAKMSGETAKLKEYFEKHSLWQNKILTVQFQGLTGKEQVPRFPVGIRIRETE
jgi:DNA ligase 1